MRNSADTGITEVNQEAVSCRRGRDSERSRTNRQSLLYRHNNMAIVANLRSEAARAGDKGIYPHQSFKSPGGIIPTNCLGSVSENRIMFLIKTSQIVFGVLYSLMFIMFIE